MHELLKEQYEFSDYQIAQLKFFFKTMGSELSKFLIMAFIFRNQLSIYLLAITIMTLLRTATGGIHCKTYFSCLMVTFSYMFLAVVVLPNVPMNKVFQLLFLFICMLSNYYIGPVTSLVHAPLTDQMVQRVKMQAALIIFFYLTITYIIPENPYTLVGTWVIILHTFQLALARILKKGDPYERKID